MKTRTITPGALPSPAWTYALMAGEPAPKRIAGWVAYAQAGCGEAPTEVDVLAQHRTALLAEAAANGFDPHFLTGRRPTGAGFEAWRRAFLGAHEY